MKRFFLVAGWLSMAVGVTPQPADVPGAGAGVIEYGPMRVAGAITDRSITESSGLAAARVPGNAGMWWTHNDSGDTPRLFLLSERGTLKAEYQIDVPFATDWEDLCSFELDGQPYLLIGDVGDNAHRRQRVTLWLVPEPTFDPERRSAFPLKIKPTQRIDFTYDQGPQDCESVAFDPVRREILLITKVDPRRPPVGQAGVYVLPLPGPRPPEGEGQTADLGTPDEPVVVSRAAELALRITTAADISPDGRRCVVGTYGDAWQYVRHEGETWAQAFARPGDAVALGPRGQSEAVAFAPDGQTLMLTTEGVGKPVWCVSPIKAE